jgi:hypothetical protein
MTTLYPNRPQSSLFEPICLRVMSQSVATLNRATSNSTVTSHADLNYPFCDPSSRPSTTMDYYHLLLTGVCTPNKSQVRRAWSSLYRRRGKRWRITCV